MRINNVRLNSITVSKADSKYQAIVNGLSNLSTAAGALTLATAVAYNAVEIHNKHLGIVTNVIPEVEKIAESIIFEINEVMPINIELTKINVKEVLCRMFPVIDFSRTNIVTYDRLFGDVNIPSEDITDEINSNLVHSDSIFYGVRTVFMVSPDTTAYDSETQSIYSI